MTTTTLVMGVAAVASDLIGRRVQVFYDSRDARPDIEGPVHAVGCSDHGMRMWVEQEIENPWHPKGDLHDVGGACIIRLLPRPT